MVMLLMASRKARRWQTCQLFLKKDKALQASRERCMMKSHDVWVLEGVYLLTRGELQPWLDQKQNSHPQLTVKSACVHTMEESQAVKNGQTYLENKRTILLGISPGNPFYYNKDNLQRLFRFAKNNTHKKVRICIRQLLHTNMVVYGCTKPKYTWKIIVHILL